MRALTKYLPQSHWTRISISDFCSTSVENYVGDVADDRVAPFSVFTKPGFERV